MKSLIYNCNQIIDTTPKNHSFKSGKELNELNILNNLSIVIENGIIIEISNSFSQRDFFNFDQVIDASHFAVLPGLIDSHSHIVFAGDRSEEFEKLTLGLSYEDIAKLGGGIKTTVSATRKTSEDELFYISVNRINDAFSYGITTLETKSGYGLDTENEIKILKVIKRLNKKTEMDIIPTFLGAHALPPEYSDNRKGYIDLLTNILIPKIKESQLAEYCDIFLEKSAFNCEEARLILNTAKNFGLKLKLHTNQFNSMGGIELGLKMNVSSLDHLEVLNEAEIKLLAESKIPLIILPGVSYFLKINYTPVRELINNGAIIVLATDFNPGSCMTQNLPLIMNIACTQMGMTINEVINATTINAAYSLNLHDKCGSIKSGKKADLILIDSPKYQNFVYHFGKNHIKYTIKNGQIVYERNN